MRLVLLGPPGVGKGTQAALLCRALDLRHVSTGELLREAVTQRTPLGVKVTEIMTRGDLVPDNLMLKLLETVLETPGGFVLDGFPRTTGQAEGLDERLKERGLVLDQAVLLWADEDEIVRRMLARGGADDTEQTARHRLEVYKQNAVPVVEYYRTHGRLRKVDGMGAIDEIQSRVLQAVRAEESGVAAMAKLRTSEEIAKIRESSRIVAGVHRLLFDLAGPGVDTGHMDKKAEEFIRDEGGEPSFLGYHGFPASTCISINEEVVHGIPGRRVIQEGDLVGVDVGVVKNGYHGDAAISFPVGEVSEETHRLLRVTEESLQRGIAAFRVGNRLGDIGHAIQTVAEDAGFGVVRTLVGHGIGQEMHEDPQVPNYGKPGTGMKLQPGMVFAIEPMLTLGTHEVKTLSDKWTIVTKDGSLAAHFEHTVALTASGPVVLSVLDEVKV